MPVARFLTIRKDSRSIPNNCLFFYPPAPALPVTPSDVHPAVRDGSRTGTRSDSRLPLVLDAAARFFAEKGFGYTSMRDIAGAAGMLPGSLYYYFASKEELLIAVYAEGVRRIEEAVRPALDKADADPGRGSPTCARRTSRHSSRMATTGKW